MTTRTDDATSRLMVAGGFAHYFRDEPETAASSEPAARAPLFTRLRNALQRISDVVMELNRSSGPIGPAL